MATGDNRFVFVCPMYNASRYVGQMLHSVCGQSYDNWKLILVDDVSSPREQVLSNKIVFGFQELLGRMDKDPMKIHVHWNGDDPNRGKQWEVSNVLFGIKMCEDDDIVCRIDADDWLTDLDALAAINEVYKKHNVDALWTSQRWGTSDFNISAPMPGDADPYKHKWVTSHLKTFRKKLINSVPIENFRDAVGKFIDPGGDQAIYLPVLRNAKRRVFLPRVTYHYTINLDDRELFTCDYAKRQAAAAEFIRQRGYVATGEPWEKFV